PATSFRRAVGQMHQLSENLLVVDGSGTVLPLADRGVEVVHDDGRRCTLLDSMTRVDVGVEHELPRSTRPIALQIGGIDGDRQHTATGELRPDLEALAIAGTAENPQHEWPFIDARQIEYEVLVDCAGKAWRDVGTIRWHGWPMQLFPRRRMYTPGGHDA